jgi:hypothetical protein
MSRCEITVPAVSPAIEALQHSRVRRGFGEQPLADRYDLWELCGRFGANDPIGERRWQPELERSNEAAPDQVPRYEGRACHGDALTFDRSINGHAGLIHHDGPFRRIDAFDAERIKPPCPVSVVVDV